ncbi:UvrD-helicase domain-containing protein [Rhodopseudomonas palustris]|uniref:UvrD-helicase domain-containing protein n=1 Tax=Rhodopseudomonas palustris TaxID=1076 RepID=UPI0021F343DB|nr:UvrD-helicase domain-containing protein [Rhodopseudomonas palustris]UYO53754.1 UvrD-helicase domain-containing protein [Rhodopseudomonas palustris]
MEETWWTQPEDLDSDQTTVVALPLNGDHLIVGPAGSGKTNLLILRGSYLYGAGVRNIAILTFGRVLKEFLVAGAANYAFPDECIQTYLQWGRQIAEANEGSFDTSGKFTDVRARLAETLQRIAAKNDPSNIMDCILLDEGQDYSQQEMEIIRRFAKQVFVVGDSRQRIYDAHGSIDYLKRTVDNVKELRFHYRNGTKICRVADGIRGEVDTADGMEQTSNYDERKYPSTVLHVSGEPLSVQLESAITEIETQLRAYPDEMIGVLCPRLEELDVTARTLINSSLASSIQVQRFADGYETFDPKRRVIVTTIHGAKGLEFRALHLLSMEKIKKFPKNQKHMAYTAVTRAKTSLAIYHDSTLPGYLDNGLLAAANQPVRLPEIPDLFRR